MIYTKPIFDPNSLDLVSKIIKKYPLASILTIDENGEPFFSHLPLQLKNDLKNSLKSELNNSGAQWTLLGHLARGNPQWRHMQKNGKINAVFHGPNAYITPSWFVSGRDVPTWNYIVIHIEGKVKLIEDFDSLQDILKSQTHLFEANETIPWEFSLPDDLRTAKAITAAIIGFEIEVTKIIPKFKLGQNRTDEDKNGIISGLNKRNDEGSKEIADLMEQFLRSNFN